MEIKPTGNKIEELYAKTKLHNFFGKSTMKLFAEELSAQLGPRQAEASQVKADPLQSAARQPEVLTGLPANARGAAEGSVPAVSANTQTLDGPPVPAAPAKTGAADGVPVKSDAQPSGSGDGASPKEVPQRILVVRNEPVVIDEPQREPARGERLQTLLAMTNTFKGGPLKADPAGDEPLTAAPVNVALLKTELLRGAPARIEPVAETAKSEPALTGPVEYIVKEGDSLWKIGRQLFKTDPYRIARDNGITNPNLIRPGQKLIINPPPPQAAPPQMTGEVTASWYGGNHHNKVTASGERFDMHKSTLAHKTLPLGTKVRLVNPDNGRFAEGVVTDRGPYIKGRDVDVSYALAQKLGFVRKGVTKLDIETI